MPFVNVMSRRVTKFLAYERAMAQFREAERDLQAAISYEFPPGTIIDYTQGVNLIRATVIRAALHRLYVRGQSGKLYFICASRVSIKYRNEKSAGEAAK